MSTAPTFQLLSPLSIAVGKTNPRKHFDEAYIARLTESVRTNGVLSPLIVRPKGEGFELVAGECRLRAAKAAQLKAVPVIVRELDDTSALRIQLIENLDRSDLHPLEEAAGYAALMTKKHGFTAATLAAEKGRSVKYIYDRLKLLDLTDEAQKLFLADRITAGHAILLARLPAKDQERAIDSKVNHYGGGTGIWQGEHALFSDEEAHSKDPYHGLKAVSVREFEAWVDRSIRFDRKLIEPVLYPETAKRVEEAEATKLKVVPITHDFGLSPELKGDERTVCCNSWKRADGLDGTKTCEHAILGVFVVGRDRGQAHDVCIAKEKCKLHWGKEMAARERAAKQREKAGPAKSRAKQQEQWKREEEKLKKEREATEAYQSRWRKAKSAILKALATAVEKAPTAAGGYLAGVIIDACVRYNHRNVDKLVPRGKTAEDLIRHAAFLKLGGLAADDWAAARGEVKPIFKALNLDLDAILDEHAPVEKSAPAKKGSKKKEAVVIDAAVGVCRECGCTDDNCEQCIEATGEPCTWVEPDLCSACAPAKVPKAAKKPKRKSA